MHDQPASSDYRNLLGRFIEEQYEVERPADLAAFAEAPSPDNTAEVTQEVLPQDGRWVVYLIFRDTRQPLTLRRMAVKYCRSRRIAEIVGAYHCRIRSDLGRPKAPPAGQCWN